MCSYLIFFEFIISDYASTACIGKCRRETFICIDACPCHADCPLGCIDCDSWACQNICQNPDELQKCTEFMEETLSECESHCNADIGCLVDCLYQFEENLTHCPCGEKCSAGCPCTGCDDCWECVQSCIDPETNTNTQGRVKIPQDVHRSLMHCDQTKYSAYHQIVTIKSSKNRNDLKNFRV